MFATSADPKTVEEMQELLEESIKGVGHGISSFWGAPRTVAGLGGLVVCTYAMYTSRCSVKQPLKVSVATSNLWTGMAIFSTDHVHTFW